MIDKPISTGYYRHPHQFGLPTVVEEVKEMFVDTPISTGHFGYPAQHGYRKAW